MGTGNPLWRIWDSCRKIWIHHFRWLRQKGRSIHKFKKTLSELLEEEEICIVRTVAYERDSMNELHARTIAIDSQGRELIVDLDDLYAMVSKEWGLEAGTPEEL